MADPLSTLRQFNIEKRKIIECDGRIIFGEYSWDKGVKTNFPIWGTGKNGIPEEYYTLGGILFMLKNNSLTHPVYVKRAAAEHLPIVRRPDRKDLLAYLNGKSDTCPNLNKTALPVIATQVKRYLTDDGPQGLHKKPRLEDSGNQIASKELVAKLNGCKETIISVNNIKSLSDAMSVEAIAGIKARRLAKKRTTIVSGDDIVKEDCTNSGKYTAHNERNWRNRNNILQSTTKDFAKDIMAVLNSIEAKDRLKQTSLPQPGETQRQCPVSAGAQPSAYNRYNQEKFHSQRKESDSFQINTKGTYCGVSLKSLTHVNAPAPTAQKMHARVSRTPIIIIPAGINCLISMYNAKNIMQDLEFITQEQVKAGGGRRCDEVLIQRQRKGHTVPYKIIDNPAKLKPDDWDRVVAVWVMGPAWQFKGYPWKTPVEIFDKIAAFHLKYDETTIDPNVARWAVTVIQVSRTKRHLDRAALMTFWEKLDSNIMKYKPFLRG